MKVRTLFAVVTLSIAPSISQAGLMDFQGFADFNTTEGTLTNFTDTTAMFSVGLTAGSSQGGNDYDPYLDYNNAGVGVCKNSTISADPDSGTGNKCKTPGGANAAGDDNLQNGEFLRLDFGQVVTVSDLFFRNMHHNLLNDYVMFSIDGGDFINYLFTAGVNSMLSLTAQTIDITIGTNTNTVSDNGPSFTYTELYLDQLEVEAVPEPSILALFGLGLVGLGFARRKVRS